MVKKYTPFGQTLSPEVAWVQAAQLLDLAATEATTRKDVEQMTNVSAGWMQLAVQMGGTSEEPEGNEEVELDSKPGYQMGFSPNKRGEDEDSDEDEYEPDEVPYPEPGEE